jgi:death-on-curing family protein
MLEIRAELLQEYERWLKVIGDDPYSQDCVIGIHDVLRAHFLLVDYFFDMREGVGGVGPKDLELLHSAINRQIVGYNGIRKWSDDFGGCATLFYGLVKNHAFHDCNKRTALLTTLYFLQRVGRTPGAPQREFENLTVRTADNDLSHYPAFKRFAKADDPEVEFIANFLKRKTRVIDKHHYIITYNQLANILSRYGFRLAHPDGNYIDLVRDVEQSTGFFRRTKQIVEKRILRIGFPGWKTQVNMSTIKRIREAAGLKHTDGVDSQAFFYGADSLEALMSTYRGPLERLANR